MTRQLPVLFVSLAMAGAAVLFEGSATSVEAQQPQQRGSLTVPIVGTVQNFDVPVEGQFTIQRFQRNQQGQIEAVGTAVFSFVDPNTQELRTIVRRLILLVEAFTQPGNAECPILFLQLGFLDIDLLGLVIELDQVTLEITAVPGPGQLLGNLLCAIAGLLDSPGPVQQLVALLNQLLGLLG